MLGAKMKPAMAHAPSTAAVTTGLQEAPISTLAALAGRRADRIPSPSQ
jgi:hypothetical protein